MGSLMAGWRSFTQDPKSEPYQRNKSFTNGEIEAYWSTKKKGDAEFLRPSLHLSSPESIQENVRNKLERELLRSNSLPVTDRRGNFLNIDSETALDKLTSKGDWWTRGNSAFLNQPPVIANEGLAYRYASQYQVSVKPDALHRTGT